MPLSPGARLGPYEIVAAIGAGGMGNVYRATDTNLGRQVAIKILPDGFAQDAERVARFEREARVLASLNHLNIAIIHGFEKSEGTHALVMELVEGEDLSQRIARGPIPIDEALSIAKQIAEALEAAHEQGIVHRDLKPANIKVRVDGSVKVLDFGLAKLAEPSEIASAGPSPLSLSPTITSPALMSGVGVLLGTAAYMSPEQARGRSADKRSDIWAFGCVLYEMLTGKQPFAGRDIAETLAAILMREPDWSALAAKTSASTKRLLRRCLEKDPRERLHDIADARLELKDALTAPADAPPSMTATRSRLPWIVSAAALVIAITGVAAAFVAWRASPAPVVTRLDVTAPSTTDAISFALSPDGRQVVFAANSDKGSQLWLRRLDQSTPQPLGGMEAAMYPFWAPDGRSLAFFAESKLKRLDLNGGSVQVLADAPQPRGGTWSSEGVIVFAPVANAGLMRVSATGGDPVPVTHLAPRQGSHRWPQFLPDGRRFIFLSAVGAADTHAAYVASLDGGEPTRVLPAETNVAYAPPGYLVRVLQGTLMTQAFDSSQLRVTGDPMPVAQGVGVDDGTFHSSFSVSAVGELAYRTGTSSFRQFTLVDHAGRVVGKIGPPDNTSPANPALAADEQHIAFNRTMQSNVDVWLMDARGVANRFTFDEGNDTRPVWSPDGTRIVFSSARKGFGDLFEKPASGAADERMLLADSALKEPLDWSKDGRFLLYAIQDSKNGSDLWALPFGGDRKPLPIVQSTFDDIEGQFSPDGRWIAYASNESGRYETYVRPFPGPGGKWQVSTAGGTQPRWSPDGKEVYYLSADNHLISARIQVASDQRAVEPGTPTALFPVRLALGGNIAVGSSTARAQYAVTRDGRFLLITPADDAITSPITIMLNWTAALNGH